MAVLQGVHSGVVELNTDIVDASLGGGEGKCLSGSSVAQYLEVVVDVRIIVETYPEAFLSLDEVNVFHEENSIIIVIDEGNLTLSQGGPVFFIIV